MIFANIRHREQYASLHPRLSNAPEFLAKFPPGQPADAGSGKFEVKTVNISGTVVRLGPGDFTVLFPHGGHLPKLPLGKTSPVKKIIFKVRV